MCNCVYLARIKGGDGGGVQDGLLQTPLTPSPSPPVLHSEWSPVLWDWRCWIRQWSWGKSCLSVWNFIIFNYLDHDSSHSPSLPLPPFHLVTQTQAFLTQPCPSAALLPSLLCTASPLLITPINIFNFCTFPSRGGLIFPLWVGWFIKNAISIQFVPLVILVRIFSFMIGHGAQKLTLNAYRGHRCYTESWFLTKYSI